jgi:small-conductance mechanosensitive channel
MNLNDLYDAFLSAATAVGAEFSSPWFYLQLGIIIAGASFAFGVGAWIRARIQPASMAMGLPAPLRMMIRVMIRNVGVAVFWASMVIARLTMLALSWPSRSYLISVCAKLAFAWLIIGLVTSVIRNEFIVRLVSLSAWLVAALSIIGQLDPVIDALDSVAIVLGGLRLTPLLLIKLATLLGLALWITSIAGRFLEARIIRSHDLTPSVQVLLVKLTRVSLMIFGVALALGAVGINLSALAIFSGAAGVGIGLGLQKVVGNFVSGIILLADKSVKPGDLVTIGDISGRISAMNTRYISVAPGDGREVLIPNEDLVTQKVVNWTYTDKNTLVKIVFGTNYDADPRLVCRLAIEIAAQQPRADKKKPPNCLLTEFTEAGMKFSLTFWLPEPDGMDGVKSDVMTALWDAFKRENIRVPYPVRELRVRGALPVEALADAAQ